ncbi:hypothetical protein SmJEL517_g02064 [Synchytrium microbalum]|uniref:PX domain-containing protein n=1 Tax=Synchytrium microbalum TaxID=1806994 RepID=A0A507C7S3_9FUNG|nr:uncharacterized protein SmJEL517_g02064 [Synchytrium microbalum]TPX35551.1 hypothetical protein SmJEL517_g02064 [Synchytrium microbalum]
MATAASSTASLAMAPAYEMSMHCSTVSVQPKEVTYQITATTNIPSYKRNRYNFSRSHSEIERLASAFQVVFPEVIVPAPAPRSLDGSFMAETVNRFLDRVSRHPLLRTAECLQMFIESQFEYVPTQTSTLKKGSSSTFRFGKPITSTTRDDPFFEFARSETAGVELHITNMLKANGDKIVKFEREQAKASGEVGQRLVGLVGESGDPLGSVLRRMAKCFQVSEDATYAANTFNDAITHGIRSTDSAQSTLQNRINALNLYTESCKSTSKKVQALEKLKAGSSIRQDKVDAALEELNEAKKVEASHRELLKRLTDSIRGEYELYDRQFQSDMEIYLKVYAERQLDFARQMKKAFDISLPS